MAAETFRITEELVVKDNTGPGFSSAEKKVSQFDRTIQQTQDHLKRVTGTKWEARLDAVDKATKVITTVEDKIHSAVGKAWNFTVGIIDKATAPLQGIFNLLKNPILQAGAILGVSVSTKDVIDTFGAFESTMSQVKAISGATGKDFEDLTALAKEMGATTKFTAAEAAEGLTYMAMAGWKTQDMMTSLSGIMNLAAASGEDLATVSDIVTDAMTAFGLAADGVTASGVSNAMHFSDVLAAASSNANTNVSMMGETFKYVGSMAGAMGYNIEDVALATGLMANSGIKGTMAGTALNSMLTRLSTNTSGAADAIKELGVEFYNSDGSARALGDVMGELRRATMGMTAAQKSELANTVAGMEAQKGLLAILNTSEEDYQKLTEAIYSADGAAQQMADTMLDNMAGSMTLLQSAVDGVKLSIGSRLAPYVRQFADWLTTKMPAVETVIDSVMDTIDSKIAALKLTIEDFTSSDEWASADIWGKISIAWDRIVAEPFTRWWESTGKAWLTAKVASFGETLGSGISAGLLAILGFDASGAMEDGKSIGASFIEGFKQGFDTEKVSEAIREWASDHKGVLAAAGIVAGGKLIGGIAKGVSNGIGTINELRSLFGGGKSGGGGLGDMVKAFTTNTMTVTAGTVIVNGGGAGQAARAAGQAFTGAGGLPALTGGSAVPALPAAGGQLALPAGAGTATAAAGGITSAGSWLSKILLAGSKSSVIGADGTLLAVQGGVGGTLGSVAGTLGSGATTAAGAAAVGAGSIAGAVGGILGLGSAAIDLFQGIGKSKEGDAKGAKDSYVTAGTKTGMVGAGAATGAAIGAAFGGVGAIPGALIGAGIGGIGALLGGSKIGKALSDATDDGGWLNETGKAIGNFFTKTLPAKWGVFWDAVGNFFTSTIPEWWGGLTETVGTFFTETIPTAWGQFWDSVGAFFTETIPYAIGYAVGKIEIFFTQTVPTFFGQLWETISTFFTSTLPAWASDVWNNHIVPFFTESVPTFFSNLWNSIATFFTETLPTWASDVWTNRIVPFFTEDIPAFFGGLWEAISTFFTETIPTWASDVWTNHIVPFFTETIPGFFGQLWDSVTGFFTQTLPTIASGIWNSICGFFTETIPNFFKDIWGSITKNFSAGYADSGAGAHAEGGIMNAPHLAQVAEDGPEAIIPLGASSRSRGMAVWEEAGDILGATGNATDGGNDWTGNYPSQTPTSAPAAQSAAGEAPVNVPVQITLNPEFIIQGTEGMSPEDVLQVIRERIRELVDDISDEMAEKLAKIFANMPVRGGA